MSCRRASLLAISFAFAAHAGRQETSAPVATHWEHTLIRHEKFDDFDGGSGIGVQMTLDSPLTLIADLSVAASGDPGPSGPLREEVIARYESRVLELATGFHDALLSWNVDCPSDVGFAFDLRVGRKPGDVWSPWLQVAAWGSVEVPSSRIVEMVRPCSDGVIRPTELWDAPPVFAFDAGKIDDDYFTSTQLWDRVQYRVRAQCDRKSLVSSGNLTVRRVVLCLSRRADGAAPTSPAPREHARIPVPFRSQKVERPEIAGKICSPTSVSMVMAYRGVDRPTAEVAERVFDKAHNIYGNWPLNVQGAYSFGVPGYLARFSKWSEVEQLFAAGQPLVISIAAKPGELDGAPYPKTDGHLLVLCGFDAQGDVLVNDPAAADATKGQTTYRRDQLDTVWLARGGTSYVLLPKEN